MGMCFNLNHCEGNNSIHNDKWGIEGNDVTVSVVFDCHGYVCSTIYVANFKGLNFCSFGS